AVVRQRPQPRVQGAGGGADLVAVGAVGEAGAAVADADEVVPEAGEGARHVGAADAGQVLGDDGVADLGVAPVPEEGAAAGGGAVVGDGDVEQDQGPGVDAAALSTGGVAADGAVGQRRREGVDAAAVLDGGVAADGAAGQRRGRGLDAAAVLEGIVAAD